MIAKHTYHAIVQIDGKTGKHSTYLGIRRRERFQSPTFVRMYCTLWDRVPRFPTLRLQKIAARSFAPISTCWIFPTTFLRSSATKNLKRRPKPAIPFSGTVVGSPCCPVTIFAGLQESRPRDLGFILSLITAATTGAVCDKTTAVRAPAHGLDIVAGLERFDSFPIFNALGNALITGPTGNNVRDLRIPTQ